MTLSPLATTMYNGCDEPTGAWTGKGKKPHARGAHTLWLYQCTAIPIVCALHTANSMKHIVQVVTTGSDRKIAYWDAYDGSAVRVTDASEDAAMCDVHVDAEGEAIVSCGADSLVQLWGYDEGHCFYTGVGHSGTVNRVRVSPDRTHVVSVGSEGGIFIWKYMKPGAEEPTDATPVAAGAGDGTV